VLPPLSLYLHFPWCVRKCPYCDFSSFPVTQEIPERDYLAALQADLISDLKLVEAREITSIYLGGGTPSLFSPQAILDLINMLKDLTVIAEDAEISMEINPGTVTFDKLRLLKQAGINRLSLGVQSFQDEKLQTLRRIHSAQQAEDVILQARDAGFENFNIDLMFGLPQQTVADAVFDLQRALELKPTHLSWYQLTLESGTIFAEAPPAFLPDEDLLWEIQEKGEEVIASFGLEHYEISAYCKPGRYCKHNLNYWQFGDYLGIGAGAHGKITAAKSHSRDGGNLVSVIRTTKITEPNEYMDSAVKPRNDRGCVEESYRGLTAVSTKQELIAEFMLNTLRLLQPIPLQLFTTRTGLAIDLIEPQLLAAQTMGLLEVKAEQIMVTALGHRFLNKLLAMF
jgi:putative oxygen-independent coproporphyrinogen III oxidase